MANGNGRFDKTKWTAIILEAQRGSQEALAALCALYWYPVYAFFRRSGSGETQALDLTQGLFARFLEPDGFTGADRARGKFRTWLLRAAANHRTNEWRRQNTDGRGGKIPHVSLEGGKAEDRYQLEPAHGLTPERSFERNCALALLDRALARLRASYEQRGQARLFEKLTPCLDGRGDQQHDASARELRMTTGAFTQAVHHCRRRFRELIRDEVARTVGSDDEIDAELQALYEILGRG